MKVFEFVEKMSLFHRLVMSESTGDPQSFAGRLGVSRATLYNLVDELNACDLEIKYSRDKQSFYYEAPEYIKIKLTIEKNNNEINASV